MMQDSHCSMASNLRFCTKVHRIEAELLTGKMSRQPKRSEEGNHLSDCVCWRGAKIIRSSDSDPLGPALVLLLRLLLAQHGLGFLVMRGVQLLQLDCVAPSFLSRCYQPASSNSLGIFNWLNG